jgi:hypothetical protein
VRQFAGRAYAMTPAARDQLGETLRARVLAVTTPPPPAWVPTHDLLLSVLAERRRRATLAGAPGGFGWTAQRTPEVAPLPPRAPRPAPDESPFTAPE